MNTKFVVGLVFLIFALADAQFIDSSHMRHFRKSEEDCKTLLQLDANEKTSNVLRTFMGKRVIPDDRNGQCVASCILLETKVVHYDGTTFIYDGLENTKFGEDQAMRARISQRVQKCLYSVPFNPDECEYGANILLCLFEDYFRQIAELQRHLKSGVRR